MNRTDTIELELNKPEARLLHNIIADWLTGTLKQNTRC